MGSRASDAAWLLVAWWLLVADDSAPIDAAARRVPRGTRRRGVTPPRGYKPITAAEVVRRALAQRGTGAYELGGGARFDAPTVVDALGNRFPGHVDCTGLVAYAGAYRRIWESADAIVDDAIGPQRRFAVVPRGTPVRAGDLLVTRTHAGVIVEVLPGFTRGGPGWWRALRVAQSAGQSYGRMPEAVEDAQGSVRVTNGYRWRKAGYFVRMLHVTD